MLKAFLLLRICKRQWSFFFRHPFFLSSTATGVLGVRTGRERYMHACTQLHFKLNLSLVLQIKYPKWTAKMASFCHSRISDAQLHAHNSHLCFSKQILTIILWEATVLLNLFILLYADVFTCFYRCPIGFLS